MQLFYQNGTLVTLASSARGNVRLLGHDRQCLAIHRSIAPHSELTAVDKMNTPMLQIVGQERSALAATVYGFIAASKDLPSGFNGECLDPMSGLYGLGRGYRWYSPVLRRFYSTDAFSPFGRGGINSYAYAGGDPVSRLDPDGHQGVKQMKLPYLKPLKTYQDFSGIYEQPHLDTGNKSLVVVGHGSPDCPDIQFAGASFDEQAFFKLLSDNVEGFSNYERLHLVSCFGGMPRAGHSGSFAEKVASLSGLDVLAYREVVNFNQGGYHGSDRRYITVTIEAFAGMYPAHPDMAGYSFSFSPYIFHPAQRQLGQAAASVRM